MPSDITPTQNSNKKLYIKTYGCQMNVYDSERLLEAAAAKGYQSTHNVEEADLVLLNTCHIREKATEKVYSELGQLAKRKQENKDLKIGVVGCVAQAEGEEIVRNQPKVDLIAGPQNYHLLPKMLDQLADNQSPLELALAAEAKFEQLPQRPPQKGHKASAFLTVQEGCDKFCSFCVVPYTRGAEFSRPASKIITEAKQLIACGVKDITLLGQNVNAYRGQAANGESGQWGLAQLIYALEALPELQRIRYTTSHPKDMDDDLIFAHRDCAKLMPFLHLPVQSGSDKVLKKMNRKHTRDEYFRITDKLRQARPDLVLSSDFIVGFPGESDADFGDTLNLISQVEFDHSFSFMYSPRPGTPAAEREQVPEEIAKQRLVVLQAELQKHKSNCLQRMIGQKQTVLIERKAKLANQWVGKNVYQHDVHIVDQSLSPRQLCTVNITAHNNHSLVGESLSSV